MSSIYILSWPVYGQTPPPFLFHHHQPRVINLISIISSYLSSIANMSHIALSRRPRENPISYQLWWLSRFHAKFTDILQPTKLETKFHFSSSLGQQRRRTLFTSPLKTFSVSGYMYVSFYQTVLHRLDENTTSFSMG